MKKKKKFVFDPKYTIAAKVGAYPNIPLEDFWDTYGHYNKEYYNDPLFRRVLAEHGDIPVQEYHKTYGFPSAEANECCYQCWKSSCGMCSWAKNFQPVEGWIAKPTTIKMGGQWPKMDDSFQIMYCPEYEKEPPRDYKKPPLDREGCIKLLCAVASDAGDSYRATLIELKKMRRLYKSDVSLLETYEFITKYRHLLDRKASIEKFLGSYARAVQDQVHYTDSALDKQVMTIKPKRPEVREG